MAVNQKYMNKNTTKEVKLEMERGMKLINEINSPIITFFGSHVGKKGNKNYDLAYETAIKLGENGFAIMSGGGPGIMHAANTGAITTGTNSIGVMANLIEEERIKDKIFTHEIDFKYMFVRRFFLSIKSEALVFFPGGYGTLNELFEFLVIIQTKMVEKVPVILVDSNFWGGMKNWIEGLVEQKMIKKEDLKLLKFADSKEEILKIIKKNRKSK